MIFKNDKKNLIVNGYMNIAYRKVLNKFYKLSFIFIFRLLTITLGRGTPIKGLMPVRIKKKNYIRQHSTVLDLYL